MTASKPSHTLVSPWSLLWCHGCSFCFFWSKGIAEAPYILLVPGSGSGNPLIQLCVLCKLSSATLMFMKTFCTLLEQTGRWIFSLLYLLQGVWQWVSKWMNEFLRPGYNLTYDVGVYVIFPLILYFDKWFPKSAAKPRCSKVSEITSDLPLICLRYAPFLWVGTQWHVYIMCIHISLQVG